MADPITLLWRHVVLSRLESLFRRGDRVLAIGRGADEEAGVLAARGIQVTAVGPAEIGAAGGGFDGAYSTFGALRGADLRAAGGALGTALRPGAPVLVSLLGPWPLPALVRRVLTGAGERRRPRAPRVAEASAALFPTASEARRALGPSLVWTDCYALGLLVPAPDQAGWASEHPQLFGGLAALERSLRRWPGLSQLGDQLVLEGRRAGTP